MMPRKNAPRESKDDSRHFISDTLKKDIDLYSRERKRVQKLIEAISGRGYSRRDTIINIIFLVGIAALFVLEQVTEIIPITLSLQLGVLLISMKIVWMIHVNAKFHHFQFWILNSLEQRVNKIYAIIQKQARAHEAHEDHEGETNTQSESSE